MCAISDPCWLDKVDLQASPYVMSMSPSNMLPDCVVKMSNMVEGLDASSFCLHIEMCLCYKFGDSDVYVFNCV